MSNPAIGPVSETIRIAIKLGILCRPIARNRVGEGEALLVSNDCFWMVNGHDGALCVWHPSPEDLICDWELTSKDILRDEWVRATSEPW